MRIKLLSPRRAFERGVIAIVWAAVLVPSAFLAEKGDVSEAAGLPPSQIIRVDGRAAAGGDGSSWEKAFSSLQDAFAAAKRVVHKVDPNPPMRPADFLRMDVEIWLAAGVYTPDIGAGLDKGDINACFFPPAHTALYGGFAGMETIRERRDRVKNRCVLSGDLAGSEPGKGPVEKRSRRVLESYLSFIDGVTIGWGYSDENGGGLKGTFVELSNCRLVGNFAKRDGGAAVVDDSSDFLNCEFVDNSCGNYGGGTRGGSYRGCAFFHNHADEGSGATIASDCWNCAFFANSAPDCAAASATIESCTFVGNEGGCAVSGPRLHNSIVWGNRSGGKPQVDSSETTYCCIEGGHAGDGNIKRDPCFVDDKHGDLHLRPESPCIDLGDPDGAPTFGYSYKSPGVGLIKDADGKPRVLGNRIDIGAYEFPPKK